MCVSFRFSVNRVEEGQVFEVTLGFQLILDGNTTLYDILSNAHIPIQACNGEFTLPGDGTIAGFSAVLGERVGQSAVSVVLKALGLEVCIPK